MLHYSVVRPETAGVLKAFMAVPELEGFALHLSYRAFLTNSFGVITNVPGSA